MLNVGRDVLAHIGEWLMQAFHVGLCLGEDLKHSETEKTRRIANRQTKARDIRWRSNAWEPAMPDNNDQFYWILRQPDPDEIIRKLVSEGWTIAGGIVGGLGAAEIMRTAATASRTAKATIFMLPVAAFLFGTGIRQEFDDAKAQIKASVLLILMAALNKACDQHSKLFPRSKIIDKSSFTGIAELSDGKYRIALTNLGGLQKMGRQRLEREGADAAVAGTPMDPHLSWPGASGSYRGKSVSPWEAFVRSSYDEFVSRDVMALQMLEAASRKP